MIGVIAVTCAVFGLTVSEAKIEIVCLRTKGIPESNAIFSVETACQVFNQTNEFVYLGGNVDHTVSLSMVVNRHIPKAWCSFRKHTLKLYYGLVHSPRAQNLDGKIRGKKRSEKFFSWTTLELSVSAPTSGL